MQWWSRLRTGARGASDGSLSRRKVEVRGGCPGPPRTARANAPSHAATGSSPSRRALSSPRTRSAAMVESHRLFNCGRCRHQVRICTSCDRGNVYCLKCSPEASRRRVREAGARYQRTPRGRLNHKVRQQRYLERVEEEVTHRGPPTEPGSVQPSLRPEAEMLDQPPGRQEVTHDCEFVPPTTGPGADEAASAPRPSGPLCCDLCGGPCGEFARRGPIRRRRVNPNDRRQPRPPGYLRRDRRRHVLRR